MAKQTVNTASDMVQPRLVVDVDNEERLPKRFRTTSDPLTNEGSENLNLKGLSDLNASGSGMFSQKSLQKMKSTIGHYPMTIVDLRQESHGFVNGMAISWYAKPNYGNKGLTQQEALNKERRQLDELIQSDNISFSYIEGKSVSITHPVQHPKAVQTEEELVKQAGLNYVRFCVTDHNKPSDEIVDQFVAFVKTLPEDTWLHFHCRGGVGRTTTFMVMYDMMKNATDVPYGDIFERQRLIGGRDMYRLAEGSYKHIPAVERLALILKFYEYCLDNYESGFTTSWSKWLENK